MSSSSLSARYRRAYRARVPRRIRWARRLRFGLVAGSVAWALDELTPAEGWLLVVAIVLTILGCAAAVSLHETRVDRAKYGLRLEDL